MRVIGTAGHVDHGKSTLIRRLTSIDPDRLAEEKAREMTIDLGFAWMPLSNGGIVGIVDVPGHRDFIENMLAGIGSVDGALLVIAADEGVMPQTREHLAILDLLEVSEGLVALTKVDLVDDPEWLDLVEHDVRDVLAPTPLSTAEIFRVSAETGEGLDNLKNAIEALTSRIPTKAAAGQPRLSVDRVFSISGFGTVVTGTLMGGPLSVGDPIEFQPSGLTARIRGLQSYEQATNTAFPGTRVAVNVAGIEKNDVQRGDLLSTPGAIMPTSLIDVRYRHLESARKPLKHNAEVKAFINAAETLARVRLLDAEQVAPGQDAWIQLRTQNPAPLARGDRFILRQPSPGETIGGGIVVDPHPPKRWRRFQDDIIARLEANLSGSTTDRLVQAATGAGVISKRDLESALGLPESEFEAALEESLFESRLVEVTSNAYLASASVNELRRAMTTILGEYHSDNPLRLGMSKEELRSRTRIAQATFAPLVATIPDLIVDGGIVRLKGHTVQFTQEQTADIETLYDRLDEDPFSPPNKEALEQLTGASVLQALIDKGDLVQTSPEVIFSRVAYEQIVEGVLSLIDTHDGIDARAVRDHFHTSRKYAISVLEHLDRIGVTRRVGDLRLRGKSAGNN